MESVALEGWGIAMDGLGLSWRIEKDGGEKSIHDYIYYV